MRIEIEPTERRDSHLKVYVEPSVMEALKRYQLKHGRYSVSESARHLIVQSLKNEQE